MRTKIITLVLAVGVSAAACVGRAEAASSEPQGGRGIVGTGVASIPCEDARCTPGLRPPTRWLTWLETGGERAWWSFNVVDCGPGRGDRMGLDWHGDHSEPLCGARHVRTRPVTGDFRITRTAR